MFAGYAWRLTGFSGGSWCLSVFPRASRCFRFLRCLPMLYGVCQCFLVFPNGLCFSPVFPSVFAAGISNASRSLLTFLCVFQHFYIFAGVFFFFSSALSMFPCLWGCSQVYWVFQVLFGASMCSQVVPDVCRCFRKLLQHADERAGFTHQVNSCTNLRR